MFQMFEFRLTAGNLDRYENLRPVSLLDFFQEAAGEHAENIGVGYLDLFKKGYKWVITKNLFKIFKSVKSGEIIKVETWPLEPGRAEFDRCYRIKSCSNEVLVEGLSRWCVLDSQNKIVFSKNISYNSDSFLTEKVDLSFIRQPMVKIEDTQFLFNYKVTPSAIDRNGHMNNTRYAEVVYDALPLTKAVKISKMQINNFRQAVLGDDIAVCKTEDNNSLSIYGYIEKTLCFSAFVELINA